MKNLYLLFSLIILATASCKSKKVISENSKTTTSNSETLIAEPCVDGHDIIWSQVKLDDHFGDLQKYATNVRLLSVNELVLRQYLEKSFKMNALFDLTLPFFIDGNIECKVLNVEQSETISRETQMRMGVYSFKGIEVGKPANTVRIDYDPNNGLKAYGSFEGKSIFLSPIHYNGRIYHVSYDKQHSTQLKTQFEINE